MAWYQWVIIVVPIVMVLIVVFWKPRRRKHGPGPADRDFSGWGKGGPRVPDSRGRP